MAKKHQNIPDRGECLSSLGWVFLCPNYLLISIKHLVINLTQRWDSVQVVAVSPEDKVGEYVLQAPILYKNTV